MDFDVKLAHALEEIESKKVSHYRTIPLVPMYARRIGLKIRPAHYRSFLTNMTYYSSIFAFFMVIPLIVNNRAELDLLFIKDIIVPPLISSLLFGLTVATYCRLSANHNSLTSWDKL